MNSISSFYFILWAVIAIYMFAAARKISPLCYIVGVFFTFMTVWYAMNTFSGLEMFNDVLGIVFKCIVAAFLFVFLVIYAVSKYKKNKNK